MKQVKDCYSHFASEQKVPRSSTLQASADGVLQDSCQYNKADVLQDFTVIHGDKKKFQRTAKKAS